MKQKWYKNSLVIILYLYRRVGYALDGGPPPPMGQPVHPSGTTLPDAGAKALPGNR